MGFGKELGKEFGKSLIDNAKAVGRTGAPMSMGKQMRAVKQVRAERLAKEFGSGEAAGDRNWSAPVHGFTKLGQKVTVSFGQGTKENQTLICRGHVSMADFYEKKTPGKGHDHYLVDGSVASKRERGMFP